MESWGETRSEAAAANPHVWLSTLFLDDLGAYYTDGVRLFRRLSPAFGRRCLVMEDCRTLDLVLCPLDDLIDGSLRPIDPSPHE